MFDNTYRIFSGIFGYEDWSWYYRIWIVIIFPIAFTLNFMIDIVVLIIRTIIGIYQDI